MSWLLAALWNHADITDKRKTTADSDVHKDRKDDPVGIKELTSGEESAAVVRSG